MWKIVSQLGIGFSTGVFINIVFEYLVSVVTKCLWISWSSIINEFAGFFNSYPQVVHSCFTRLFTCGKTVNNPVSCSATKIELSTAIVHETIYFVQKITGIFEIDGLR
ncbi:hypothetical protein [Lentilactobacillus senioris]|uniref:hypothetical protein n=1 Tax=Lentilactobacillus senioris TaxID=931534 RepID=UPI003D2781DE